MKTMAQVDAWYEIEMNKAKLEGKLEGEVEGKLREKKEIALNLLQENVPLETISRTTGFTISELEGFANEQLQQRQSNP